jgi:hypothetical protein
MTFFPTDTATPHVRVLILSEPLLHKGFRDFQGSLLDTGRRALR